MWVHVLGETILCLTIHSLENICVISSLGLLWINLLWIFFWLFKRILNVIYLLFEKFIHVDSAFGSFNFSIGCIMGFVQDHVSQHFVMDGGGVMGLHSNQELLSYCQGVAESQFSSGGWPQVGFPCSSEGPYTCAHMVSSSWTLWIIKKIKDKDKSGFIKVTLSEYWYNNM